MTRRGKYPSDGDAGGFFSSLDEDCDRAVLHISRTSMTGMTEVVVLSREEKDTLMTVIKKRNIKMQVT